MIQVSRVINVPLSITALLSTWLHLYCEVFEDEEMISACGLAQVTA